MKNKIQDTAVFLIDSLEANPFVKGAIPAVAGVGLSLIEHLEQWLRIGSLVVGFCIGSLTLYLTIRKVIRDYKSDLNI